MSKPSLLHFKFANFAALPHEKGNSVLSEKVNDAQGRAWQLYLWPGGRNDLSDESSGSNDPFGGGVFVAIMNKGTSEVHASATFIIKDGEGKEIVHQSKQHLYKVNGGRGARYTSRSWVIGKLDNEGALLIDMLIQVKPPSTYTAPTSDLFISKMLALFDGGIGSDVTFKVGDHLVHAHKLIIQANSQLLFDCIENNVTPVSVDGISKDAFIAFLRCYYGGSVSDSLSVAARKGIITAADRFDAPHIKIAAETSLAGECDLMSDSSVSGWYEFSHYKTCPLLKEQASSYFILRGPALLRSASSDNLRQSPQLMVELMAEVLNHCNGTGDTMGVAELRKELAVKELEVDGSKEILLSRLQSSKKRSRDE